MPTTKARPPRRRVGRPANSDSAATQEALLRAAVETFAVTGLARTTLRQVSEAAGLTTGTLYHHYRTKESLYVAAYAYAVDQVYGEFSQAIVGKDTLRERLLATLQQTRRIAERSPATLNLILRAWVEHVDASGEPIAEPESVRTLVRTLVDDATRNGEILPSDRRQVFNVHRCIGWGLIAIALTGNEHLERAASGMRRVLLGSMFTTPAP